MYDPALGRFHTQDPLAILMPTYSPYLYVYNNPLMFIDPTGMYAETYYNVISSTVIGPDGTIIKVIDDGSNAVYMTFDPNWDGDNTEGLTYVGNTPEPMSLKGKEGKNFYSEEIRLFLWNEAKDLGLDPNWYTYMEYNKDEVKLLVELYSNYQRKLEILDELLKLIEGMPDVKKQVEKIMKEAEQANLTQADNIAKTTEKLTKSIGELIHGVWGTLKGVPSPSGASPGIYLPEWYQEFLKEHYIEGDKKREGS